MCGITKGFWLSMCMRYCYQRFCEQELGLHLSLQQSSHIARSATLKKRISIMVSNTLKYCTDAPFHLSILSRLSFSACLGRTSPLYQGWVSKDCQLGVGLGRWRGVRSHIDRFGLAGKPSRARRRRRRVRIEPKECIARIRDVRNGPWNFGGCR